MSDDSLEQALVLVSQRKFSEAQNLLKPLIAADPHNITAWLLLVETYPSNSFRLKILEHCLTYNSDNLQIRKSVEELRSTFKDETNVFSAKNDNFASSQLLDTKKQISKDISSAVQNLDGDDFLKIVADKPLTTRKEIVIKKLGWFIILIAVIVGSIAVRLSSIGFYLLIFGILLLVPIAIHFFSNLFFILFSDINSPKFSKIFFFSNLLLFLWFLTQPDIDDSNTANAFAMIAFLRLGVKIPHAIVDLLSALSNVFAIGLIISWITMWRNMKKI